MESIEKFRQLTLNPKILDFFEGLFEKIGIRVIDTGEAFTCIKHQDSASFHDGIDEAEMDFSVDIDAYQVDRLVSHIQSGELDEVEQFRVLTTFFAPVASAGFNNPAVGTFMTGRFFSWFINRKKLTHLVLLSPQTNEEPDVLYSLLFVNQHWLLIPGLHGQPERVFNINKEKGLELHRKMFSTMKTDRWGRWLAFARWYKRWRSEVEIR